MIFSSEFQGLPGGLLALLKEFSKSEYVSDMKKKVMESPFLRPMLSRKVVHGIETHVTREGLEPLLVYSDFLNGLMETMSIVRSTQIYVKRAELLRRGYPSNPLLLIIVLLVLLCFGLG